MGVSVPYFAGRRSPVWKGFEVETIILIVRHVSDLTDVGPEYLAIQVIVSGESYHAETILPDATRSTDVVYGSYVRYCSSSSAYTGGDRSDVTWTFLPRVLGTGSWLRRPWFTPIDSP